MSAPTRAPRRARRHLVGSAFAALATAAVVAACAPSAVAPRPARPPVETARVPAADSPDGGAALADGAEGGSGDATARPASAAIDFDQASAWTDEAVVRALAIRCSLTVPDDRDKGEEASALSCASGLYAQSCAADPCYDDDQTTCQPECEAGCRSCSSACAASCDGCAIACKDEPCRAACAQRAAACAQECLASKDRCSSGQCAARYKACSARLKDEWRSRGCAAHAKRFDRCQVDCENHAKDKDADACEEGCRKVLRAACGDKLASMYLFNGTGPDQN